MADFVSNTNMNWDAFSSNLCEMNGTISRKPIDFKFSKVEVWFNGGCIYKSTIAGILQGTILNGNMHFSLDNSGFENQIAKSFTFEEITTNQNRMIWSKDLMNEKNLKYQDYVPFLVSLFYKNGELMKAAFNVHNQNSMVELYK